MSAATAKRNTPEQAAARSRKAKDAAALRKLAAAAKPAAPSFRQVLNDPEGRAMVEGIEDIVVSLRHRPDDRILRDLLVSARDQLKAATGYDYSIDDILGSNA